MYTVVFRTEDVSVDVTRLVEVYDVGKLAGLVSPVEEGMEDTTPLVEDAPPPQTVSKTVTVLETRVTEVTVSTAEP